MVGALLSLPEPPEPDHAADALAVAICHANGAPLRAALPSMIASVRGTRARCARPDHVVVEAAGVGYRLAVSAETLRAVPGAGRRGAPARRTSSCATTRMHLFGFATEEERELFLMLVGVQGVGPKVALAVLSRRRAARAAQRHRRRRRGALPGRAGHRQAHGRAHHRRAAREGRPARTGRPIVVAARRSDDPRSLAREGLRRPRATRPQEADELLDARRRATPPRS